LRRKLDPLFRFMIGAEVARSALMACHRRPGLSEKFELLRIRLPVWR
jgi:hypothetical protein